MAKKSLQEVPPYEEDWSDYAEPYTSMIGLAGDAIGIGTTLASGGTGSPVGATIAGIANIPNLVIDGYQATRDAYRTVTNDNKKQDGLSTLKNVGELALDIFGMKALNRLNQARKAGMSEQKVINSTQRKAMSPTKRVGTGASRSAARRAYVSNQKYNARYNKAMKESIEYLAKRGVRSPQGAYYTARLSEEMAKRGFGTTAKQALESVYKTQKQNKVANHAASAITDSYNILNWLTNKK